MPLKRGMLQDVQERMMRIETVLLGVPNTNDKGLVGEVKELKTKYRNLSTRVWLIIVAIAGSGALGGGIYQLLR